jgi:hypothetical protein
MTSGIPREAVQDRRGIPLESFTVKAKKPQSHKPTDEGPVLLSARVSPETADLFDGWLDELNQARSWPKLTRSDLLRFIIERALQERPEVP